MKYTREERIDIGRRVYSREMTHREAREKYGLGKNSVIRYVDLYKEENAIPSRSSAIHPAAPKSASAVKILSSGQSEIDLEAYMAMSKEELINELILAKANELRAKKGYEVKGVGANKEFISLNDKNTK